MLNWLRIQSKVLNETRIFRLLQVHDRSPHTHKEHQFFVIDSLHWVNLVPVTEQGEIVMVRQYRHGSQRVTLEIPGGMIDAGECPTDAAKRECLEETGYIVDTVSSLGVLNPNPALFDTTLFTFVGRVVGTEAKVHVSETENTEVELVTIPQIKRYLLDGTIDHALVCTTLWRFLDQWDSGSLLSG
jgi:8-oxo-dGTP pyrophosphatase MutT (NUDIX family)